MKTKSLSIRLEPLLKLSWIDMLPTKKKALLWYVRKLVKEILTQEGKLESIVIEYEKEKCNL
jgi:hypothetical protein